MLQSSVLAVALCAGAMGEGFEFADFSSTKALLLVLDAHRSKKVLRLTGAEEFEAGAAWFRNKQPVLEGFETTFTFRLTKQDPVAGGADGVAFVVQNERKDAIGGFGASGGFLRSDVGTNGQPPPGGFRPPILRRVAVFFDTFQNRWDDSDNHVAICTNGTGGSAMASSMSFVFEAPGNEYERRAAAYGADYIRAAAADGLSGR
ncbi:MAG TPA: L-type lectin-domain containing protein [Candidatus Limnocylindrales bacterium]|nr:L-type lectin-domain containing protein [Candidatus Limnocylindrales bacterium]